MARVGGFGCLELCLYGIRTPIILSECLYTDIKPDGGGLMVFLLLYLMG